MRFQSYINEQSLRDWKFYVKSNKMLSAAINVLKKIEKKGYRAWAVGGAVRDIIVGKQPHDIDIATTCPMDVLSKIWKTYNIGSSQDFGIVTVKEGGYDFEIAQLRGETYAKPKYVRKIL
jgi:tRNA nucleotidyltransferase/poly(A) polymerase